MKILQINSVSDFGSTGRMSVELAKRLNNLGHKAYIAYGQGTTNYSDSYKIGTNLENHFHNLFSRLYGKQGYSSKNGTRKLVNYIEKLNPNIIHLHNLHGNYLNIEILFNYLRITNIPVMWTLHDCWAFTGKCSHYTRAGCYRWQTICHQCPQVRKYPPSLFFDRSREMFIDKRRLFTSVDNMTIIPVSKWLAEEVRNSFLAKYPIRTVYNWVDQSIFRPRQVKIRDRSGLDREKFIILGVSGKWKNDNKLNDFIQLSKLIPDDMEIILVGKKSFSINLPDNIKLISYIHDTSELAKIYSIANVYVHLSMEDTFGMVIAEALSCGTPAIVYNSTACPELIKEGSGLIVDERNVRGVLYGIKEIRNMNKQRVSNNCVQHSKEKFNYIINTDKIINIYKDILR